MKPTAAILCLFFAVTTIPIIANAGQAKSSAAPASHPSGSQSSGASAAKVKTNDLHITKHLDKSSPWLFGAGPPKAPVTSK